MAASVCGVGNVARAAGDLCGPPAAAMSPDDIHNHQPLADHTTLQGDERNGGTVTPPAQEGDPRRILVGNDPGGAGLQGLLMVKVSKGAEEGEVLAGDSVVMESGRGGTTVTDDVPQRRAMLLGEDEERILQEYLQRSDTAVIFPEPVEQGKNESRCICCIFSALIIR